MKAHKLISSFATVLLFLGNSLPAFAEDMMNAEGSAETSVSTPASTNAEAEAQLLKKKEMLRQLAEKRQAQMEKKKAELQIQFAKKEAKLEEKYEERQEKLQEKKAAFEQRRAEMEKKKQQTELLQKELREAKQNRDARRAHVAYAILKDVNAETNMLTFQRGVGNYFEVNAQSAEFYVVNADGVKQVEIGDLVTGSKVKAVVAKNHEGKLYAFVVVQVLARVSSPSNTEASGSTGGEVNGSGPGI